MTDPAFALRSLVADWREAIAPNMDYASPEEYAIEACAQELEQLVSVLYGAAR